MCVFILTNYLFAKAFIKLVSIFPTLSSFGLSCPEAYNICSIAENNGLSAKISNGGMVGIMLVTGKDVEKKAFQ